VCAATGASDDSWEARWQHAETRSPFQSPVSEGDSDVNNAADGVSRSPSSSWRRWRACEDPWDPYLWAADMEDDSGSLGSSAERRPSPGGGWDTGPGPDLGPGADPTWALAYYGEDYFGTEVVRYAQSLGQHSGSACLDVKAQVGESAHGGEQERGSGGGGGRISHH
jgi:hypothetical protein